MGPQLAHIQPAIAYRVEYNGRSVVITGDTAKCPQLLKFSRGVDLLVSEASCCNFLTDVLIKGLANSGNKHGAKLVNDVIDYHIDVQDVVDTAAEAHVPLVALTHLVPAPRDTWVLEKVRHPPCLKPSVAVA